MIEFIYLILLIGWTILIFGFSFQDYTISFFASILLMISGIYILGNGIGTISSNNITVVGLGIIHIAIAGYVMIRGGYELYKND